MRPSLESIRWGRLSDLSRDPRYTGSLKAGRPETAFRGDCCLIAVQVLPHFAALLRLERQGCGRTGQQTGYADGFAGFSTPTILARVDTGNCLLDFFPQITLAIARA